MAFRQLSSCEILNWLTYCTIFNGSCSNPMKHTSKIIYHVIFFSKLWTFFPLWSWRQLFQLVIHFFLYTWPLFSMKMARSLILFHRLYEHWFKKSLKPCLIFTVKQRKITYIILYAAFDISDSNGSWMVLAIFRKASTL